MINKSLEILTGLQIAIRGGEVYLKKDTARKFITECEKKGCHILGIELFEIRDENTLIPLFVIATT